ncbi:Prp18-domain-containing protein [Fistulina hepatica ATCC 64428]|nr:Prp18-domain-containing protein [Fistulina hepatica ATCC 64428]
MDALKAEIAVKRKAIEDEQPGRPSKYLRRSDIERLREQELASQKKAAGTASASRSLTPAAPSGSASPAPAEGQASAREGFNISNEETIRRLRQKGQPIRLFGESDKDRRLRLRALELIEERGHDRQGGQNDFKKALEDVENTERELKSKGISREDSKDKGKAPSDNADGGVLDLNLVKTDPDKLYPLIYYALKRTLREWGEAMQERPEHVKRTHQGKLAAATQVQSAEYLKPLFKSLRSRSLAPDVLARIAEIVHYMQKREYLRANDSYLRLSIGNAPWPIGVTMVGIHERSAREKISTDLVAHVLNDEVSRKYIQSLKRLLTFSQTKYPPDDISQLMG